MLVSPCIACAPPSAAMIWKQLGGFSRYTQGCSICAGAGPRTLACSSSPRGMESCTGCCCFSPQPWASLKPLPHFGACSPPTVVSYHATRWLVQRTHRWLAALACVLLPGAASSSCGPSYFVEGKEDSLAPRGFSPLPGNLARPLLHFGYSPLARQYGARKRSSEARFQSPPF